MSHIEDSIYEILECNFSEIRDENKERALSNILEVVRDGQVICSECIYYTEYEIDSSVIHSHCSFWGKDEGGCFTEPDSFCGFGKKRNRPGVLTVDYTYQEWISTKLKQIEANVERDLKLAKVYKQKLKDIKKKV